MIIKFCYQNEIHRCSEPPVNFEELTVFLKNMFRTEIPSEFNLYYVNQEKQDTLIASSEDYNKLKEIDSSKPLKIVIVAKNATKKAEDQPSEEQSNPKLAASGYEVIQQPAEVQEICGGLRDDEQDPFQDKAGYPEIVEKISEDFTQLHVMPKLQGQPDASTQENVRRIVKDVLKEQVPYIISQVKESLIRDGLINVGGNNYVNYGHNWNNLNNQAYQNYNNYQRHQVNEVHPEEQYEVRMDNQEPNFFDKMINAISAVPGMAAEAVDNFAQKIEGDPYVVVAEGKYYKSTVDKVEQLREIFPEESRQKLLDFVQGLPRALTLDQIVDVYVSRGNAA